MSRSILSVFFIISLFFTNALAQTVDFPYIHDPISPDFTTRTAWTCKDGFKSPVAVVVEYASIRSQGMSNIKALSVAGKSASGHQLDEINSWLNDKWIGLILVTCNDPDQIEIRVTAYPSGSEETSDFVLVSDTNGAIHRKN